MDRLILRTIPMRGNCRLIPANSICSLKSSLSIRKLYPKTHLKKGIILANFPYRPHYLVLYLHIHHSTPLSENKEFFANNLSLKLAILINHSRSRGILKLNLIRESPWLDQSRTCSILQLKFFVLRVILDAYLTTKPPAVSENFGSQVVKIS